MTVLRAVFHHPDLSVTLYDLRFDLADFLMHQIAPVFAAVEDCLSGFFYAVRTERVCLSRESQRRLGFLP